MSEQLKTRQLAAIMFADIMGYTAMMQDDENKAIQLKDKFRNKLEAELLLHGGRLVKFSGDGALCSYNSALEAVTAAVNTQLHMLESPTVPVRIGIHQADVVFDENDVYGDGVNIASRLESMAVPGSILVSAKVIDDIKNHKELQFASLGKYVLKNVKEPIEVFAISNMGLQVPMNKKLEGKAEKFVDRTAIRKSRKRIVLSLLAVLVIGLLAYSFIRPWMKKQHAKNELLPSIQRLMNDNYLPPTEAFDIALEAEKYLPEDSALIKWWPVLATIVNLNTEPAGAEVWWKDYDKPAAEWRLAGITPLKETRLPRNYLRFEIRKKGYQTIEYAGPDMNRLWADSPTLVLDQEGSLPEQMVRIPAKSASMIIVGLEANGPREVPSFLMDKYEVTNKEYKAFMDAGAYTDSRFWTHPILLNGKEISKEEAFRLFIDKTGRPGPANWEAGVYPDGQENFPVTGVSWYEAAAYAVWKKKQLPTVFHWSAVAQTWKTQFIVLLNNYQGKGTTAVGSHPGYSTYGIYDLAGNAREWCFNENKNKKGLHFILGGGWNDPTYSFNDSYIQPDMDRSLSNGFRCIKELPGDTSMLALMAPVEMALRDYSKEKPVDDKTFAIYKQQFLYDKTPLNVKIEATVDDELWTAEKITFDAGYNNERMQAWLYLPKGFKPPYQVVLFYGSSGDLHQHLYRDHSTISRYVGFILKGGRAIVRPIFKSTFERFDELKSDLQNETVFYKDHVVMWRKDIGRTIDYLETRTDIQKDKIGFLGWSWGGFMGGIMPAVEQRLKAVVLHVGGMEMSRALPEADQINFLPRITQPVLMLNGKHDLFFPVETSQIPMFNFLGTPKENKKIIIYDAGHLVPRTEFVKETLLWFDKYLGPVNVQR